jgi:predicted nucleotide-binding protein (sugar kinase/HSP70/actin superfamily)
MLLGKTRFLFLPSMINMPTATAAEVGFYCPMVHSNAYMLRTALGLDRSSTLTPVIRLKHDPDILALEIAEEMGWKLGLRKSQIKKAVERGLEAQAGFVKQMQQRGKQILDDQRSEEPLVVVTGRPYNLYDNRVNLRLGENLAKTGVKAIPMDFVDVSAVDLSDFPSMYWGLGAQILRTAKFVRQNPNFFGLHLTNFECGPDSFIEHFFKHVMGEKAYLILELDEHSGVAGVMTRLEAYKNVIENSMQKVVPDEATEQKIAN